MGGDLSSSGGGGSYTGASGSGPTSGGNFSGPQGQNSMSSVQSRSMTGSDNYGLSSTGTAKDGQKASNQEPVVAKDSNAASAK